MKHRDYETPISNSNKSTKTVSSRGKRQRVGEGELVWELQRLFQEKYMRRKCMSMPIVGVTGGSAEDDAMALEYLCQRHGGDVSLAELAFIVELSGGRGKCAET